MSWQMAPYISLVSPHISLRVAAIKRVLQRGRVYVITLFVVHAGFGDMHASFFCTCEWEKGGVLYCHICRDSGLCVSRVVLYSSCNLPVCFWECMLYVCICVIGYGSLGRFISDLWYHMHTAFMTKSLHFSVFSHLGLCIVVRCIAHVLSYTCWECTRRRNHWSCNV